MDKTLAGLAGEYYVLAQLTHRNLVATLTLSNTKGVDILVTNQDLNKFFKVEVKTTNAASKHERLFGPQEFYTWPMSEKHERIVDKHLFYCFVVLQGSSILPKFFIVTSGTVAKYVKWQHQHWLDSRKKAVALTSIRKFRIRVDDSDHYENNWRVFG